MVPLVYGDTVLLHYGSMVVHCLLPLPLVKDIRGSQAILNSDAIDRARNILDYIVDKSSAAFGFTAMLPIF